jgi:hypothetical protein
VKDEEKETEGERTKKERRKRKTGEMMNGREEFFSILYFNASSSVIYIYI